MPQTILLEKVHPISFLDRTVTEHQYMNESSSISEQFEADKTELFVVASQNQIGAFKWLNIGG